MENLMCYECKKSTVLKEDYNEGDLICTECGLVLDSHLIDLRQEWRTLELDLSSKSLARAEKSPDVFFKDARLFTTLSKPRVVLELGSDKNSEIMKLEKKYGIPKYRLNEGFNAISTMGDKLALVKTIKDRALEIYKIMMDDLNSLRGQNNNIVAISCLYTACQLEKNARTFKEIVAVANVPIEMRHVSRTSKKISQELQKFGYSVDKAEMSPAIYARRFCSHLQMNKIDVKAILETIANSKQKLDIRRTPTSIVATTIFMISQLSTDKRKLTEISRATNVGETTISATYKQMSPFTNEIVPQWFLNHCGIAF